MEKAKREQSLLTPPYHEYAIRLRSVFSAPLSLRSNMLPVDPLYRGLL
ncbi:MAG: hypothetical protein SVY10_12995 [Thermodesulfobacteriota bacterium]|nr:hypothetical protein [Thermodesulfobacteriota bacterium]